VVPDDPEPEGGGATRPGSPVAAGTDETLAAPAAMASGTDETMAAPAGSGITGETRPAGVSGSGVTQRRTRDADSLERTVGDEMRDASLERFDAVERDRYDLLDELARGGLGRIFRARDPRTGRIVAIKEVLRPNDDIVLRFVREALVTANLQHPSIVPVYEVGRWPSGEPFYAMKLVRGRTLEELIVERRTLADRLALVPHLIDVADALAYAHSERVIHRDLKPANVLVGAYGETVVIDWGLARNVAAGDEPAALPPTRADAEPGETIAGSVIGTPAFMPPEQARGAPIDERADVYAIGAMLYHVLTGHRPFHDVRTVDGILAAVEAGAPRAVTAVVPDAPPELIAIVGKAMARAPADRYPDAAGLAEDLRRFLAGKLVAAHEYTARQLVARWVARHRAAVLVGAIALAALITAGAIAVWRIAAERDVATHERTLAQRAQGLAEDRLGDSLEELGRIAAVGGDPDRALPLLEAAVASRVTPAAAMMLGQVRATYAGLVAVVPGHVTGTLDADLTPDGTLVITAGPDQVQAWDTTTGTVRWQGPPARLARVSPDGRWLVVIEGAGELSVHATVDGRERSRWTLGLGPDELAVTLAWAPGRDRFAIGTSAGRVMLGAVDAAALTAGAVHRPSQILGLAFSADGSRIASVASDGVVIGDAASGATVARLVEGAAEASAVAWLDADRVATGNYDGIARIWRLSTARVERRVGHGTAIYGLTVDPGGGWLATFGDGEAVAIWDLRAAGDVPRSRLLGHRLGVYQVVAVGAHLVTLDEPGWVQVWDPMSGVRVRALPTAGLTAELRVRGDRVLVASQAARARVWRISPGTAPGPRAFATHAARVRDLVFDSRGATLWTASNDGTARGTPVAGGAPLVLGEVSYTEPAILQAAGPAPPNPRGLRSLELAPDGRSVITAREDGELAVWDVTTGAQIATWVGHTGRARKAELTRDGRTAFSIGDTTLRRWEVATGRETARAELGDLGWDVVLFANDTVVATLTDEKRTVALWNATTLAPIPLEMGVFSKLRDLVVAADHVVIGTRIQLAMFDAKGTRTGISALTGGFAAAASDRYLVTGTAVGEIAVFDVATLNPIRHWRGGDIVIAAVQFRPDGAMVATASGRRARIWDPATGHLLAETPELSGVIVQLAWSPDGTRLALGGGSGTVYLWDLSPASPAAGALSRCLSPWLLEGGELVAGELDPASCKDLVR
jgi:WD40 repeat protein/tRNA A-37 threonylcarbamoyl transferase component Bud32